MGKSSKERICEAMYETAEFKSLLAEVKERLASTKITKFEGVYHDGEKKSSIRVVIETDYMGTKKTEIANNTYMNASWWSVPKRILFDENSLKAIFKANFGILKPGSSKKFRVPTYNVKFESAKDEFLRKGDSHLALMILEESQAVSKRIANEVAEFCLTPEADQMKLEAADRYVIDTIKNVLLRFKDAKPEVIRQATEEYICTLVMDF